MRRTWSTEDTQLFKETFPRCNSYQLSLIFPDKTAGSIKAKAQNLSLTKDKKRFYFTEDQIMEIKSIFHNTQNRVLAAKYNCSIHTIESRGFKLGLRKDLDFIAKMARIAMQNPDHGGRKSWHKKGYIPQNKGMKQTDYMSAEMIERTKATQFKKGQSVWNHKEIGYEGIRDGYIYVKIAEPKTFVAKQRKVWEENFGAIPKGWNVQFKDGNPLNCDPFNLYIISRKDQLKHENSMYAKYPLEMQLAIKAKGALNRQINKLTQNQTI